MGRAILKRITGLALSGLVLVLLLAGVAAAAEVAGSSTTIPYFFSEYLQDEERNYIALYEFVDVSARDLGTERLDFYFAGWGRADAMDKLDPEDNAIGDAQLDSVFVRWRDETNLLDVTLGRHLIATGPVAESIDSVSFQLSPVPWFGVEGFGGVPVFSSVGERDGDMAVGGRIHGGWRYFEVGFSPAWYWEKGDPNRNVYGGDVSIWPVRQVDIMAHAYFDMLFTSWYDVVATAVARPVTGLKLLGEYRKEMPSAFLGMGSIFSVFSFDTITQATGSARYVIARRVVVSADYDHYIYDGADPGDRYGGMVGVLWGESRMDTVAVGAFRLDRDENGYLETRGYFHQSLGKLFFLALDAIHYTLDEEEYGVGQGFNGIGSLGWHAHPLVDVQATGMYLTSPFYDSDLRGLLKISYRFGAQTPGVVQ
jgi:hypothetical protein